MGNQAPSDWRCSHHVQLGQGLRANQKTEVSTATYMDFSIANQVREKKKKKSFGPLAMQ